LQCRSDVSRDPLNPAEAVAGRPPRRPPSSFPESISPTHCASFGRWAEIATYVAPTMGLILCEEIPMKMRATLLSAALMLAACQPAPDPEAIRAQQAAAQEQAAEAMAKQFDEQFAAQNWRLAKAHGDVLLAEYPDSQAAARIKAQHAEATSKASAAE